MSGLKLSEENSMSFFEGTRNGFPIGLGYFAVSFSLGIAAHKAGLSPFQAFLSSLLCSASAGQYAAYTLIDAMSSYAQVAVMTLIANARYMLMSCAMSQRMSPKTGLLHRLAMSFAITDELFAINISRPGYLDPYYCYGAVLTSVPLWAIGTLFGAIAGNVMPIRLVSALSVALYGMFLAVIIPPAKKSRVILSVILVSFASSFISSYAPMLSGISSGTRTIILTVTISALAALFFPVKNEQKEENT